MPPLFNDELKHPVRPHHIAKMTVEEIEMINPAHVGY